MKAAVTPAPDVQPGSQAGVFAHRLGCPGPDIHTTRGLTKDLLTCRGCGGEILLPKPLPGRQPSES
jgi:hypothetical protein